MADEYPGLKSYVPGSEVRIKTVLDHKANIQHVNYVFRNRRDGASQAVIPYEVRKSTQQRNRSGNIRTPVELVWEIPSGQAPGPYLIESITATTFEGDPVDANFDFGAYAGFIVEAEPEEPPYASGWETS